MENLEKRRSFDTLDRGHQYRPERFSHQQGSSSHSEYRLPKNWFATRETNDLRTQLVQGGISPSDLRVLELHHLYTEGGIEYPYEEIQALQSREGSAFSEQTDLVEALEKASGHIKGELKGVFLSNVDRYLEKLELNHTEYQNAHPEDELIVFR